MPKILVGIIILIVGLVALKFLYTQPAVNNQQEISYSWLELGPDTTQIARAITSKTTCPEISLDGKLKKMQLRAKTSADSPVISCEMVIPKSVSSVSIGQIVLPKVPTHPKKILVIGDTGCRLKGDNVQNCDDPKDWPFAQVARVSSEMKPDLIIHVGDNLYRQDPCPSGNSGCQGSPYGNNWQAWQSDFFDPVTPLLHAAPWVVVRGNHETCSRAGLLWYEYLAPQSFTGQCEAYSKPYLVNFDNLQLLNVDSAQASDFDTKPEEIKIYKDFFSSLPTLSKDTWLITHRPTWAAKAAPEEEEEDASEQISGKLEDFLLHYADGTSPKQALVGFNHTLQQSMNKKLLDSLQLFVSGHYHNFQTLSFGGVVPPQLIVGNSGTKLETGITDSLDNLVIADHIVKDSSYLHQFGFVIMEEMADQSWTAKEYDVNGDVAQVCVIKNRTIICE